MTFDSFKAVVFTVAFLMPGFVWSAVLSAMVPRRPQDSQIRFLEFLTLSFLNNSIWSGLIVYFWKSDILNKSQIWASIGSFIVLFVSPLMLGLLSGSVWQKDHVSRFLRGLGLRVVNPIPTAWDWYFARQQAFWTMVTLQDGSKVFGYFGSRSFAGDAPGERDLYLERVYKWVNSDWETTPDNYGTLIKADQIVALEFYKTKGLDYE